MCALHRSRARAAGFLSLLLLAVAPGSARAQWTRELALPAADIYSLTVQGDTLLAGVDQGAWVSVDGGATWTRSADLPGPATSFETARMERGRLWCGTYGQGVFTSATVWVSDAPVRVFNVVMGRWQVKQRDGAAVYYDARHPYNVEEMLDALVAARHWFGEWFAPYPYRELRLSEFPGLATYAQGPPTNITFSENIGFLTKSEPRATAAFWVAAHEAAHQWWPLIVMSADGPGGEVLSEGMAHFSTVLLVEKARGLEQRLAFCRQIEDRYGNLRRADEERPLVRMDGQLPTKGRLIYDRGGFVLWMMFRLMGEEAGRAGLRDYIATYRDAEDRPLLEDLLEVMRRHAPDPAAFDAFTAQWFFATVVPEFLVVDPVLAKSGDGWTATAQVRNVGTGRVRVVVAAARGERFADPAKAGKEPRPAYADARTVVELGPGEEKAVLIPCSFEPERVVVDPDIEVLMLRRSKAQAPVKAPAG